MQPRTATGVHALDGSPDQKSRASDQIDARIQKQPDSVDKAPIDADHLKRRVIGRAYLAASYSPKQHIKYESNADSEMDRMQPGCDPVEYPEQLSCGSFTRFHLEIDDWHHSVLKVLIIFVALDAQKRSAKHQRDNEPPDHSLSFALRARVDRQDDCQAAGEQNDQIHAAAPQNGIFGCDREFMRIGNPIYKVSKNQSSKEQRLVD